VTTFDAPVLLHVGWPRTGTTTLQALLGTLPNNVARPFPDPDTSRARAEMTSIRNDADWDPRSFVEWLDERRAATDADALVLSDEALVGSYTSDRLGHAGPLVVADRLQRVLPSATVWFTLRDPRSMVRSTYLHAVSRGYPERYATYLREARAEFGRIGPWRFDIARVIDGYAERFGPDRVVLSSLAGLLRSPVAYWQTLADRAAAPEVAALGDLTVPHVNATRSRRPSVDAWLNRRVLSPVWQQDADRRLARMRWDRRLARIPLPRESWPPADTESREGEVVELLADSLAGVRSHYSSIDRPGEASAPR
jgi:hypothetical protein